jgi:hypothetical protein
MKVIIGEESWKLCAYSEIVAPVQREKNSSPGTERKTHSSRISSCYLVRQIPLQVATARSLREIAGKSQGEVAGRNRRGSFVGESEGGRAARRS